MANYFRNTSFEKKLSKFVKSIKIRVTCVLKSEKENNKVDHCNDIAQIVSKICGIRRRQILNIKENLL